jgi:hypothetical protein
MDWVFWAADIVDIVAVDEKKQPSGLNNISLVLLLLLLRRAERRRSCGRRRKKRRIHSFFSSLSISSSQHSNTQRDI